MRVEGSDVAPLGHDELTLLGSLGLRRRGERDDGAGGADGGHTFQEVTPGDFGHVVGQAGLGGSPWLTASWTMRTSVVMSKTGRPVAD